MMKIRQAELTDAKALAVLSESTFRDTYTIHNTPEDMELHCDSNFGTDLQEKEISNPKFETLVVENDDELIAYALLRWGNAPDCVKTDSTAEILRFYVDVNWHGKGVAQQLMSSAIQQMKEQGAEILWLGVWEENIKAIRFYKKFNFYEAGRQIFTLGEDPQRDLILALKL